MKWCSLCCYSLPEDSSKRRQFTQHLVKSGPSLIDTKTSFPRKQLFLRSIIRKSYDISHPIGCMQIPLENTKTVQELPDPSLCMLVMQYIQHCGKGRGLGLRLQYRLALHHVYTAHASATHPIMQCM